MKELLKLLKTMDRDKTLVSMAELNAETLVLKTDKYQYTIKFKQLKPKKKKEVLDVKIHTIGKQRGLQIVENPKDEKNKGLFIIRYDDGICHAIDNKDGNAWTEEFKTIKAAIAWLHGKFEIGDVKYPRKKEPKDGQ